MSNNLQVTKMNTNIIPEVALLHNTCKSTLETSNNINSNTNDSNDELVIRNSWNKFKQNYSNFRSDTNNNSITTKLSLFSKISIPQDNNIQLALNDIGDTNISKVRFYDKNDSTIYSYNALSIPNNIVELNLSNCVISNLTFEHGSNIRKIVFDNVNISNNVKLCNTIEHIDLHRCNINFVDCTFDNTKHVKLCEIEENESYEWMGRACYKATEYVEITIHVNYVNAIPNANAVYLSGDNLLDKLNSNVKSIKLFYGGGNILDIIDSINNYKNLEELEIICSRSNECLLNINSENLRHLSLCFDPLAYDDDVYTSTCSQKVKIASKKLEDVRVFNCTILSIYGDNVTYGNFEHTNLCDLDFKNIETLNLDNCHISHEYSDAHEYDEMCCINDRSKMCCNNVYDTIIGADHTKNSNEMKSDTINMEDNKVDGARNIEDNTHNVENNIQDNINNADNSLNSLNKIDSMSDITEVENTLNNNTHDINDLYRKFKYDTSNSKNINSTDKNNMNKLKHLTIRDSKIYLQKYIYAPNVVDINTTINMKSYYGTKFIVNPKNHIDISVHTNNFPTFDDMIDLNYDMCRHVKLSSSKRLTQDILLRFNNARTLDLSQCNADDVYGILGKFNNLKQCSMKVNRKTDINNLIGNCNNLEKLKLNVHKGEESIVNSLKQLHSECNGVVTINVI